ncbi:MFS transporter [Staphylococcus sp. Mo2-7]
MQSRASATIGSQNLVQAFVSQYFPAYIRSTALGTASGIGRVGGMIGPLMGGFLLTFALPMPLYFIAFAIPGLIVCLSTLFNTNASMQVKNIKKHIRPKTCRKTYQTKLNNLITKKSQPMLVEIFLCFIHIIYLVI